MKRIITILIALIILFVTSTLAQESDTAKVKVSLSGKQLIVKAHSPNNVYVRKPGNGDTLYYLFLSSKVVEFECNDSIQKILLTGYKGGAADCYFQAPDAQQPKKENDATHILAPNITKRRNWIELHELNANTQVDISLKGDSANEQKLRLCFAGARGGIDDALERITLNDALGQTHLKFHLNSDSTYSTDTLHLTESHKFLIPSFTRTESQKYNLALNRILLDKKPLPFKVYKENKLLTDSCSDDIMFGTTVVPVADSLQFEAGLHTIGYECVILTSRGPQTVVLNYVIDVEKDIPIGFWESNKAIIIVGIILLVLLFLFGYLTRKKIIHKSSITKYFKMLFRGLLENRIIKAILKDNTTLPDIKYDSETNDNNSANITDENKNQTPQTSLTEFEDENLSNDDIVKVVRGLVDMKKVKSAEELSKQLKRIGLKDVINKWNELHNDSAVVKDRYTLDNLMGAIDAGYVGCVVKDRITLLLGKDIDITEDSFNELIKRLKAEGRTNGLNEVIDEWNNQDGKDKVDKSNHTVKGLMDTIDAGYVGKDVKAHITELLRNHQLSEKITKDSIKSLMDELTEDGKKNRLNEIIDKWNGQYKGKDGVNKDSRTTEGLMAAIEAGHVGNVVKGRITQLLGKNIKITEESFNELIKRLKAEGRTNGLNEVIDEWNNQDDKDKVDKSNHTVKGLIEAIDAGYVGKDVKTHITKLLGDYKLSEKITKESINALVKMIQEKVKETSLPKEELMAIEAVRQLTGEKVFNNVVELCNYLKEIGQNEVIDEWNNQDDKDKVDKSNHTVKGLMDTIDAGYVGKDVKAHITELLRNHQLSEKITKDSIKSLMDELTEDGKKTRLNEIIDKWNGQHKGKDGVNKDSRTTEGLMAAIEAGHVGNVVKGRITQLLGKNIKITEESFNELIKRLMAEGRTNGLNEVIDEWNNQDDKDKVDKSNHTVKRLIEAIDAGYVGKDVKTRITKLLGDYKLSEKITKESINSLIDELMKDGEKNGLNGVINKWNKQHENDSVDKDHYTVTDLMNVIANGHVGSNVKAYIMSLFNDYKIQEEIAEGSIIKLFEQIKAEINQGCKAEICEMRNKYIAQVDDYLTAIAEDLSILEQTVKSTSGQKQIFISNLEQIVEDLQDAREIFNEKRDNEWKLDSTSHQQVKENLRNLFIRGLRKNGWINNMALMFSYSRIPALPGELSPNEELEAHGISTSILERVCANIEAMLGAVGIGIIIPAVLANNYSREAYDYENGYIWIDKFFTSLNSKGYKGKVFDIIQVGYTEDGNLAKKPTVQFI